MPLGTVFANPVTYITGIRYPEDALKKDLWEIIKQSRTPPKYATDEIAKEKGMCL